MSRAVSCTFVLQYFRVVLILGIHALFVLLTLARANRDDSWNWSFVFIPLFIFDAFSIVYWILYLLSFIVTRRGHEFVWTKTVFPGQSLSLLTLIAYGVGIPLKIAAEISLVMHLQEPSGVRVIIPAVFFMLLFLEVGLVSACETAIPIVKTFRNR